MDWRLRTYSLPEGPLKTYRVISDSGLLGGSFRRTTVLCM